MMVNETCNAWCMSAAPCRSNAFMLNWLNASPLAVALTRAYIHACTGIANKPAVVYEYVGVHASARPPAPLPSSGGSDSAPQHGQCPGCGHTVPATHRHVGLG